mmetsp:Transcript_4037/g.14124  ORF Transcript_4037/g.14124 Transcript_4037/m.14124 type:complete len:338 (+) Transcript_4037:185-1198(+)
MLMDLLKDSLGLSDLGHKVRRVHFHDFMLDVHSRLRQQRRVSDPLVAVADSFTKVFDRQKAPTVLLLDELMVTDVADAMVIHRLFGRLWERGTVLVATSNRAPKSLYENGLQRALFLPFIDALGERCEVHDIFSQTDHRMLATQGGGSKMCFVGPGATERFDDAFVLLSGGEEPRPERVEVMMGRTVEVNQASSNVAAFTFQELCERNVAAADYLALAKRFHTIGVEGVPIFTGDNKPSAYRFVTLVDVLYECRVRLFWSAEAGPAELLAPVVTQSDFKRMSKTESCHSDMCVDDNLGFAKDRTVSRLVEMQSVEYARQHATERAPELLPGLREGPG